MEEQIKTFCYYYNATVGPSNKQWRRPKLSKPTWDPLASKSKFEDLYGTFEYEDVPMVEIQMPVDRFNHLVEMRDQWNKTIQRSYHTNDVSNTLWSQYEKESRLRHQYPALQNLWEQYQAMLALVGDGT